MTVCQVDLERAERLKLEHAVKTGSLPDDAKVGFSSVTALVTTASHVRRPESSQPASLPGNNPLVFVRLISYVSFSDLVECPP